MKRTILSGLLAVAMLLPLTFAADPPGEPEEPPVRLKKKDRPGAPKPEPEKKVEPEPKPEPMPEPKPEPMPDEKGEPDAPPPPEETEEEILDRLLKNTKKAQDRLANREVGEGTRQLQRDILDDIDKLIKQNESDQGGGGGQDQQDQQDQQGQKGQQGQQKGQQQKGGMGGGKSQGMTRRQQRQMVRRQRQGQGRQQQPGQGQGNQGQQPMPNTEEAGVANQGGGGGRSKEEMNKIADLYKDVWGHLPETLRAEMNAYSREKFMAKYKDLIEKYYSNLAEKNRKSR